MKDETAIDDAPYNAAVLRSCDSVDAIKKITEWLLQYYLLVPLPSS